MLNIHDIPDELRKTIAEKVKASTDHFEASDKLIGFLADNAAVNFGSLKNTNAINEGEFLFSIPFLILIPSIILIYAFVICVLYEKINT